MNNKDLSQPISQGGLVGDFSKYCEHFCEILFTALADIENTFVEISTTIYT